MGDEWLLNTFPLGMLLAIQHRARASLRLLTDISSVLRFGERLFFQCIIHAFLIALQIPFCGALRCQSVKFDLFEGQRDNLQHHGNRNDSFVISVQLT